MEFWAINWHKGVKIYSSWLLFSFWKFWLLFRWSKFTLKPHVGIMTGKLQLANWDTSFWTFLSNLRHKGPWRHILGPILVLLEICYFLAIPGPFEYFSENGWSQKIKVFLMEEYQLLPYQFSFRRADP